MDHIKLIFEDQFIGTDLDPAKWSHCPEWSRHGKSQWKNELAYVDGEGHLVVRMEWDKTTEVVNCGAVWTNGLFEYGYGYYEARIKFTPHHGAWGAFWLMMGNLNRPTAAEGLEIDIVESIGNDSGRYQSVLHWNYPDLHSFPILRDGSEINVYDGEFHTFGVLRAEDGYTFYVDGQASGHATPENCLPCPLPGHMLLTCEAAEWSGAGTPECIADMPAEMTVDYVRVYDGKPAYLK